MEGRRSAIDSLPPSLNAVFVTGLALLGTVSALVATSRWGPGVTPDGVNYMSAARSLADGTGYLSSYGDVLTVFPPGFPLLLAGLSKALSLSPVDAGRLANAVVFGAIVLLAYGLAVRTVSSRWLRLVPPLIVAASPALQRQAVNVWSEPLFIALALASILVLLNYTSPVEERPGPIGRVAGSPFLLAALLVVLVLTRFVGVTLVLTCTAIILLQRDSPRRRRLRDAGIVFLLPTAALVAWGALMNRLAGTWYGHRDLLPLSLWTHLHDAGLTLLNWVALYNLPRTLSIALSILAVALAVAVGVGIVQRLNRRGGEPVLTLTVFVVVYLVSVIVARMFTGYERLDDRLLSPCYVPLVLIAVAGFEEAWSRYARSADGIVAACLVGVGIILVAASGYSFARQTQEMVRDGVPGATAREFRQREIVGAACGATEGHEVLLTNQPESFSFLCERSFDYPPGKTAGVDSFRAADFESLQALLAHSASARLIWLSDVRDPLLYSPHELDRVLTVRRLREFPDGAIYEIRGESR